MKRTMQAVCLAVFAAQTLVVGQGEEVKRVLSQIRAALGGEDKLTAVKSITVEGQSMRPAGDGSTVGQDFEMAFDLPANAIKFMKKEVVANLGTITLRRRVGFNGGDVIDETDAPPSMGEGVRLMRMGPGGPMAGGQATPEQLAAQKAQLLVTNRREFARLALGMLGTTTTAYPVEFTYAGTVDSTDGKADVLEVKSSDGFAAKLYVDGKTHLPLMLAWMDKEPLRLMMGNNGGSIVSGGGGGSVRTFSSGGGGQSQDPAKLQEEMNARLKEAEAARKMVEYRLFYAEYKTIDGVRMPTKIQKMVDGLPTEEMSLDKIKINGKIDSAKFAINK